MPESASTPWTVLRLINWTKDYFARCELDSPRLTAEMLLAHVMGCKRMELYTRFDHQPATEQLAKFRELVKRAGEYEPAAYLTGSKEFYSLKFAVTPDVLVPRPETELLVSEAVTFLRGSSGQPMRLWDVCTGSGCVAVAVAASVPTAHVLATDVSPAAVELAARNAESHKLADRVRCRTADLLVLPDDCSDWAVCDAITANPPYVGTNDEVSKVALREPHLALYAGSDGLDVIRRLVADAPARLRPGGMLIMEFGFNQADAVRDLLVAGEFDEPKIMRDQAGLERTAVAMRKGASSRR